MKSQPKWLMDYGARYEHGWLDRAFPMSDDDWLLAAELHDRYMVLFRRSERYTDHAEWDLAGELNNAMEHLVYLHETDAVHLLDNPELMNTAGESCDTSCDECWGTHEDRFETLNLFPRCGDDMAHPWRSVGAFSPGGGDVIGTCFGSWSRRNIHNILERMLEEDPQAVERMQP